MERFACTERTIEHLIEEQREIRRLKRGLSEKILSHTDHISRIILLYISQKHISIHINLKSRISHLIEIENRLLIVAISVITDTYEEFIEVIIASVEVRELEEIILGGFPIVRQEIGVGKHLIWKDIIIILQQSMERQSFCEDEISVFEQGKRKQSIPII